MAFRIGRRHAQHTYPEPPTGAGLPLLQIGSDMLDEDFDVTGVVPLKVPKAVGLLQVPLPGFQRINGLWLQFSVTIQVNDTAPATIQYLPWVKFATVPQFFSMNARAIEVIPTAAIANPDGMTLTIDLCCLVKLPAASADVVPIALPAVGDLLVGLTAQTADADFVVVDGGLTLIAAGEINSSIITQIPTVVLLTVP